MEKDICEPYRALKDGLKAVRASEVTVFQHKKCIFLISDLSVSSERHSWYGEHPEQEQGDGLQDRAA